MQDVYTWMLGNELNNLLKTVDTTALVAHTNYKNLAILNTVFTLWKKLTLFLGGVERDKLEYECFHGIYIFTYSEYWLISK